MLSYTKTFLKNIFWQFSYLYGALWVPNLQNWREQRSKSKSYSWSLSAIFEVSLENVMVYKYFFQSQKWLRPVIKRLLPKHLWYWWLYQSSKVKNCDISKYLKMTKVWLRSFFPGGLQLPISFIHVYYAFNNNIK